MKVKVKEIIGAVLMAILTISGILLTVLVSITSNLNSKAIIKSMSKSDYFSKTEEETMLALKNYISEEKLEEVLKDVNIESDIKEMVQALESGNVTEKSNNVKERITNEVLNVIDENVDEKSKTEFANQISDTYIKTIFPITQFDLISVVYNKYSSYVQFIAVILSVIIAGIYTFLAISQKTYKWNIIATYNVVFINIMLVICTLLLNDIVVGNARVTSVLNSLVTNIRINIVISILITLLAAILSNYIAYFRHNRRKKQ